MEVKMFCIEKSTKAGWVCKKSANVVVRKEEDSPVRPGACGVEVPLGSKIRDPGFGDGALLQEEIDSAGAEVR